MNVEIYGYDNNFVTKIPDRHKIIFQEAIGQELSHLDDETIKALEKAKHTLVVDVLDIKDKGLVVDGRLFDKTNMPVSGKTCLLEMSKLNDFADPKILAQHFSSLAKKLVENAKMLR